MKILNNLWPLMEKLVQSNADVVDAQTKEVLLALGAMLGKETISLEEKST